MTNYLLINESDLTKHSDGSYSIFCKCESMIIFPSPAFSDGETEDMVCRTCNTSHEMYMKAGELFLGKEEE